MWRIFSLHAGPTQGAVQLDLESSGLPNVPLWHCYPVSLNLSPSSPTSWLEGTSAGILEATTLLALCWERREAVMLVQLATIDEARKWWLRLTSAVSGRRHLQAWRSSGNGACLCRRGRRGRTLLPQKLMGTAPIAAASSPRQRVVPFSSSASKFSFSFFRDF